MAVLIERAVSCTHSILPTYRAALLFSKTDLAIFCHTCNTTEGLGWHPSCQPHMFESRVSVCKYRHEKIHHQDISVSQFLSWKDHLHMVSHLHPVTNFHDFHHYYFSCPAYAFSKVLNLLLYPYRHLYHFRR